MGGNVTLRESAERRESKIINALEEIKAGIDNRTGKGGAAERIIEEYLLRPALPPRFECRRGSICQSTEPDVQSPAFDRVINDSDVFGPLVPSIGDEHAVFPIESVAGVVEITMRLDAGKLREDIQRISHARAMRTKSVRVPVEGTKTERQAFSLRLVCAPT
jgi:uncharacterized protein DUF6602